MGNQLLRLKKDDTVLVGIDFQERLMPAMENEKELEEKAVKLVKGCRMMGVPVFLTQQYTKGLGSTVPTIAEAMTVSLGDDIPEEAFFHFEKTSFSAMGEPEFAEALENLGRKNVIIAGIEAHVCVQQTVIDLLEKGYHVLVAADCISSRSNIDKQYSQNRMSGAGAVFTTYESILFELCKGAKEPGFKQISTLVK